MDANEPEAAFKWKHWYRTLTDYFADCEEQGGRQPNKLRTLTKCVSHSIYQHIDEIAEYDDCIQKLTALFCKPPNEIFVRHRLATRQQESNESIDEFLIALRQLSKDCSFQAVSAERYRDDLV